MTGNFLCAWCVDRPAVTMELEDGKNRPVCDVCSSEEVPERSTTGTLVERALQYITANPGCTTGAMRLAWKLNRGDLDVLIKSLWRLNRDGRVERTGVQSRYQYWPKRKEAA